MTTKPNIMTSSKQMGEAGSTFVTEVPTNNFCWEVDLESPAQELPGDSSWCTIGKKIIIPTLILTIIYIQKFHKLYQLTLSQNDFIPVKCFTWRAMERMQSCLGGIMDTRFIKACKRSLPLLTAIWMLQDIALDIHQTVTYYYLIDGFDVNGEYHDWALQYKNETNSTRLQTLSAGYFYTACAVWIIPPILFSFLPFVKGVLLFPDVVKAIFNCNLPINKNRKNWFIFYPAELLGSIVFIYILIPFAAMKVGLKHLLNEEVDDEEKLIACIDPKVLPFFKFWEIIGEALPSSNTNCSFCSKQFSVLKGI